MTDTEAGNFGLGAMALLQRADFQALIDVLAGRGYSILGPTVRNGTVVYEEVGTIEDLPIGLRDEQGGGHYRLGTAERCSSVRLHQWRAVVATASLSAQAPDLACGAHRQWFYHSRRNNRSAEGGLTWRAPL